MSDPKSPSPKPQKPRTNGQKGSVVSVPHRRKVRILLWGGAATPGDNGAFGWAEKNVRKDYASVDKGNFAFLEKNIRVAKDIVNIVNAREDGSIRSLDLFTHGGPQALYLTTASPRTNKMLRYVLHNSSLYRGRLRMVFNAAAWTEGSALIADINFAKFTPNARIELHGCRTADPESASDNIAADFSIRLCEAGKNASTVIGHADKANPNIHGGGERNEDQDYRHGQRIVFQNGRLLEVTKKKGHISDKELEGFAGKAKR